jgi:hypothetical protein
MTALGTPRSHEVSGSRSASFGVRIGFQPEQGFEEAYILGARAAQDAARLASEFIERLAGDWGHPDALRTCSAVFASFR